MELIKPVGQIYSLYFNVNYNTLAIQYKRRRRWWKISLVFQMCFFREQLFLKYRYIAIQYSVSFCYSCLWVMIINFHPFAFSHTDIVFSYVLFNCTWIIITYFDSLLLTSELDAVVLVVKLFVHVWNRDENTDKEMLQKRL